MRGGGGGGVVCSLQQSLTAEAGTTVKQAISLAKRRGHAQVTPIHVASVMLVSPAAAVGLLRTACLKSHSHPLQCKVLELCFNVALNRLPTMTPPYYNSIPPSGTTTHHHDNYHNHHEYPSLSNALVAAFKRAQAHQRRGTSNDQQQQQQQQSILTVKIEAEQLVISILDDPSVSRVMREAGFSSTLIKSNVVTLAAVSLQQARSQPPPSPSPPPSSMISPFEVNTAFSFKPSSTTVSVRKEDVSSVFESLASQTMTTKKKNTIIVGECLADCEGVVRAVKERIERGGTDVPLELRHVQFLSLPIFSIKGSKSREEVDLRLGELKCLLERSNGFVGGGGTAAGRGIVLYLGDLKWLSEFWGYYKSHGTDDQQLSRTNYINDYCPLEHMIMGLRRLVFGCNYNNNGGRLWLMGIATFSSYIKCKSSGHKPSLETLLDLHPLTIPVGGLELSLNLNLLLDHSSSDHEGDTKNNIILLDEEKENCDWGTSNIDGKLDTKLTCCTDCSANFHREARSLSNSSTPTTNAASTTSSSLPYWLQKCIKKETKDDSSANIDQEDDVSIKELCKKWNSFCSSTHNDTTANYLGVLGKVVNFSDGSPSPSSPTSISSSSYSSYDQRSNSLTCPAFDPAKWPSKARNVKHQVFPFMTEQKPDLLSNPSSTPNSASSSEEPQEPIADKPPFVCSRDRGSFEQEHNTDNLTAMCLALEKRVPWQKGVIPDIASTVLKCRAGLTAAGNHSYRARRRGAAKKQGTTWFSFLGADDEGKVEMARELARLVFGSQSNFRRISFTSSNFASAASGRAAGSTDHHEYFRNKRGRDHEAEGSVRSYLERFAVEIKDNPHRVFYVEDVDQVDGLSQKGIKRAIETGEIILHGHGGEEVVPLKDAVVILSCDSLSSDSRAFSPPIKQKKVEKSGDDYEEEAGRRVLGACLHLDLNIVDDREIGSAADEHSFSGDVRVLEAVDMQIFFKIQEL